MGVILYSFCSSHLEERDKKDLILGPGMLTVPIEPVASDMSLHLTRLSVLLSPRERAFSISCPVKGKLRTGVLEPYLDVSR